MTDWSSSSPQPSAVDAVRAFRTATDREAARRAADDLAHLTAEDAVAVSPGADRIVAAVRRLVEDGVRWRADAFSVLIYALDHANVWRRKRAATRTYRGQYDRSILGEEAVEQALTGFDAHLRDILVDPDPETRAMACLLLARISSEPAGDRELLRLLLDDEQNALARACAAEAMVRLGDTGTDRWLTDGSAPMRHRIARYLDAAGRETALVYGVLAEPQSPDRWWPAEQR